MISPGAGRGAVTVLREATGDTMITVTGEEEAVAGIPRTGEAGAGAAMAEAGGDKFFHICPK